MTKPTVFVAELWQPGQRIQAQQPDDAAKFERYVHLLERELCSGGLALTLFERAMKLTEESVGSSEPPHSGLTEELVQDAIRATPPSDGHAYLMVRWQAEITAKRHFWQAGEWPLAYRRSEARIYARAFVFAIDNISNLLRELMREPGVPAGVKAAYDQLVASVPMCRDLRDSLHHVENRGLGRDRYRHAINADPITTGAIRTGGGQLVILETLEGRTFSGTAADGSHASIDLTGSTLEAVGKVIQQALSAFTWEGEPAHLPA
jgi:hypothetical protein